MPPLRSRTVTHGRNMAGARALLRATGVAREDIGKPIIAVANSFTEFVPGHVHLREVGQVVAAAVREAGAIPREFNTIAVDDGIAMGHGGMLYSLPQPGADRRLGGVHGERALRGRHDLHLELRQDHAGHADRHHAAEHPDRVRVRRADGGRRARGPGAVCGRLAANSISSTRWWPRPIPRCPTSSCWPWRNPRARRAAPARACSRPTR